MKTVPVVIAAVALSLTSCSEVEGAARDAASEAASKGVDQAKGLAAAEAQKQACALVQNSGSLTDGAASAAEKEVAKQLASAADTAGVPQAIVDPLTTIGSGSADATKKAIADLTKACPS